MEHNCTQKELLEEKFKTIIESLKRIELFTEGINERVTNLEAKSNTQKGAMIAITGIYTLTVAIIAIYLSYKGI